MIYAHVVGGYIVNRILWDGVGDPPVSHGQLVPADEAAGIPDLPPPPEPVPDSVPAHHLRLALRAAGMLAAVRAYMDALPEDDEMRESWEYAPYFRRDAIGIEDARVALGLTVAQVDDLFRLAGQVVT